MKHKLLLIITAFIWGIAFVAQSKGGKTVGPYTFNCIRCLLGAIALLPVILFCDHIHFGFGKPKTKQEKTRLLIGGVTCGTILCIASNLQQLGLYLGASAGKAGFLTACYILIVPILGIFLKKRCHRNVWIGIILTILGLYLLCMKDTFAFKLPDLLILLCAIMFAIHIMVIDYFSPLVDGVRMSCIQFTVCGILSSIPMYFSDMQGTFQTFTQWITPLTTLDAWIPLLYAGICSCGIAYTLQIIGQRNVSPAIASLLMSLESVFSVLAGWLLLKETMNFRELSGCVLIFIAVILAQLPTTESKTEEPNISI